MALSTYTPMGRMAPSIYRLFFAEHRSMISTALSVSEFKEYWDRASISGICMFQTQGNTYLPTAPYDIIKRTSALLYYGDVLQMKRMAVAFSLWFEKYLVRAIPNGRSRYIWPTERRRIDQPSGKYWHKFPTLWRFGESSEYLIFPTTRIFAGVCIFRKNGLSALFLFP